MIRVLLITCCFLSSRCFADNWEEKWSDAALNFEKGEWVAALHDLDEAIDLNKELSYLHVDRARLHLLQGNASLALNDIDIAFSGELSRQEKLKAITVKLMASAKLGICEALLSDLNTFKSGCELPLIHTGETKLIIRNVPNNPYYQKIMTCYLIHSGLCYDKEEFNWLKSGSLVAEKINHCGCQKCIEEYTKTRECDACFSTISPTKSNVTLDELIVAFIKYVSQTVEHLDDQMACLTAACHIQEMGLSIELFDYTFDHIINTNVQ